MYRLFYLENGNLKFKNIETLEESENYEVLLLTDCYENIIIDNRKAR